MSEARAERIEVHPWGVAVATPSLPAVWDANFLAVDRWSGSGAELTAERTASTRASATGTAGSCSTRSCSRNGSGTG